MTVTAYEIIGRDFNQAPGLWDESIGELVDQGATEAEARGELAQAYLLHRNFNPKPKDPFDTVLESIGNRDQGPVPVEELIFPLQAKHENPPEGQGE